jgi:hypothetical protein
VVLKLASSPSRLRSSTADSRLHGAAAASIVAEPRKREPRRCRCLRSYAPSPGMGRFYILRVTLGRAASATGLAFEASCPRPQQQAQSGSRRKCEHDDDGVEAQVRVEARVGVAFSITPATTTTIPSTATTPPALTPRRAKTLRQQPRPRPRWPRWPRAEPCWCSARRIHSPVANRAATGVAPSLPKTNPGLRRLHSGTRRRSPVSLSAPVAGRGSCLTPRTSRPCRTIRPASPRRRQRYTGGA